MNIDLLTKNDFINLKEDIITEVKKFLKINEQEEVWLKASEVKRILGCSGGTLMNLKASGRLPCSKVGGRLYFKKSDLDLLFSMNTVA